MNFHHCKTFRVVAAVVGMLVVSAGHAEVVIVAAAKSSIGAVSAEQVSAVFLGKGSNLPGAGGPVLAFDLEPGPVRDEAYLKLANKTASQMSALRANLVFSGKGKPPKVAASPEELIKWLQDNPNAVGYLDKGSVNPQVKVLVAP